EGFVRPGREDMRIVMVIRGEVLILIAEVDPGEGLGRVLPVVDLLLCGPDGPTRQDCRQCEHGQSSRQVRCTKSHGSLLVRVTASPSEASHVLGDDCVTIWTMKASSSSSDAKCVARWDTRCSTRPLKTPCSTWVSAWSCTTNAHRAGKD